MINHDETFNGTWPFKPNFFNGNGFKQHYIDEGPKDGNPIIMLHGEPTWGIFTEILFLSYQRNIE